jgi:uncharacterized membrane protein HdeD (DUF308 family)
MGIVAGIAAIVLGIVAIIFPVLAFSIIEYLFALYAILMSASLVATGLDLKTENRTQGWLFTIAGIAGVLIGIAIIVAPRIMAVAAINILALWAIIAGASDIVFVFTSVTGAERSYKAATGSLTLVAGLLILAVPKAIDGFLLVTLVGIFAILMGILTLLFAHAQPRKTRPVNHLIYK